MAKDIASSTQEHLPIAGIQDGVVIMNDASIRTILKVEPINFELKSEAEQNAIVYSYQSFLNSLEFPIQIVVHSKKLDLERYLIKLEATKKNVTNDLLRIQVEDYVDFVRRLISIANIMSKRFYMIISYSAVAPKGGRVPSLSSFFNKHPTGPILYQDQFDRFRLEAINRANLVAGGISRLGLKVSYLDTQELIEVFYSIYNPDIAAEERLTDVDQLSAGIVSSTAGQPGQPVPAQTALTEVPTQPSSAPTEAAVQEPVIAVPPEKIPFAPMPVVSTPTLEEPKGSPMELDPEVDQVQTMSPSAEPAPTQPTAPQTSTAEPGNTAPTTPNPPV